MKITYKIDGIRPIDKRGAKIFRPMVVISPGEDFDNQESAEWWCEATIEDVKNSGDSDETIRNLEKELKKANKEVKDLTSKLEKAEAKEDKKKDDKKKKGD